MAMVDTLAQMLSERTGTKFEVLRGRPPVEVRPGRMVPNTLPPMRYGLRATRGDFSHTFQGGRPMKLADLTRWLASLNDMVNMGLIPTVHLVGEKLKHYEFEERFGVIIGGEYVYPEERA